MRPTKIILNAYDSHPRAHAALREIRRGVVNLALMEHRDGDTLTMFRAFPSLESTNDVMAYEFRELNVFGITDPRILEMLQMRVRWVPSE